MKTHKWIAVICLAFVGGGLLPSIGRRIGLPVPLMLVLCFCLGLGISATFNFIEEALRR